MEDTQREEKLKLSNWWASCLSFAAYKSEISALGLSFYDLVELDYEDIYRRWSTAFFMLSLCIFLAKYDFLPSGVRKSNAVIRHSFELVENLLLTDLGLKFMWTPLCSSIPSFCSALVGLTKKLRITGIPGVVPLDKWLSTPSGWDATRLVVSLFVLYAALESTDVLKEGFEKVSELVDPKKLAPPVPEPAPVPPPAPVVAPAAEEAVHRSHRAHRHSSTHRR